jgi:hypothetical protein
MTRFYVPKPPVNFLQPRPTVVAEGAAAVRNTLSPNPRAQLELTLMVRIRNFRVALASGELA